MGLTKCSVKERCTPLNKSLNKLLQGEQMIVEYSALNHQLSQKYGFEVALEYRPSALALEKTLITIGTVLMAQSSKALNIQLRCYDIKSKEGGTNYEY